MKEESNSSISDSEYEIDKIVGKRIIKGIVEYKVKWLGYDETQSTWEPIKHLINAKEAINEYENYLKMIKSIKKNTLIKPEKILSIKFEKKEKNNKEDKKMNVKIEKLNKYMKKRERKNSSSSINYSSNEYSTSYNSKNNIFHEYEIKNEIEIIEVTNICELNKILYGSVIIKEDNKILKEVVMKTKKIAEIAPKKLINYYEKNINFYN
jgi:hypothetical protein